MSKGMLLKMRGCHCNKLDAEKNSNKYKKMVINTIGRNSQLLQVMYRSEIRLKLTELLILSNFSDWLVVFILSYWCSVFAVLQKIAKLILKLLK